MDQKLYARPLLVGLSIALSMAVAACGDPADAQAPLQPSIETGMQRERLQVQAEPVDAGHVVMTMRGDALPVPRDAVLNEDADIVDQVDALLRKDESLGGVKIDVHSADGVVTLRGTAPDPAARERAGQLVQGIRKVKSVDNQLTLG